MLNITYIFFIFDIIICIILSVIYCPGMKTICKFILMLCDPRLMYYNITLDAILVSILFMVLGAILIYITVILVDSKKLNVLGWFFFSLFVACVVLLLVDVVLFIVDIILTIFPWVEPITFDQIYIPSLDSDDTDDTKQQNIIKKKHPLRGWTIHTADESDAVEYVGEYDSNPGYIINADGRLVFDITGDVIEQNKARRFNSTHLLRKRVPKFSDDPYTQWVMEIETGFRSYPSQAISEWAEENTITVGLIIAVVSGLILMIAIKFIGAQAGNNKGAFDSGLKHTN